MLFILIKTKLDISNSLTQLLAQLCVIQEWIMRS